MLIYFLKCSFTLVATFYCCYPDLTFRHTVSSFLGIEYIIGCFIKIYILN